MDMTATNRTCLAIAAAAVFGIGTAGTAQAGQAKAFSVLQIQDFGLFKSDGSQWDIGEFSQVSIGNRGQTAANITGVPGATFSQTGSGNINPALACVDLDGATCAGIGENNFNQQGPGHFSRGDSRLDGAIVANPNVADRANADALSETQLDVPAGQTASGTASSEVGTTTEFEFEVAVADDFDFQFDAQSQLEASLTGTDDVFASAAHTFRLSVRDLDGNLVFDFEPTGGGARGTTGGEIFADGCDLNDEVGVANEGTSTAGCDLQGYRAVATALQADTRYRLIITHETSSGAEVIQPEDVPPPPEVPEPATLALMGLGLLGIGAMGLRRRRL